MSRHATLEVILKRFDDPDEVTHFEKGKFEAVSLGAEFVVFNELDKRRFQFIKSILEDLGISDKTLALKYHSFRCLRFLKTSS